MSPSEWLRACRWKMIRCDREEDDNAKCRRCAAEPAEGKALESANRKQKNTTRRGQGGGRGGKQLLANV